MVTTFSLLFANFGLNGFTEAILQSKKISRGQASNLFWLNVGIGALLTVSFAGCGSILARFYHNDLITHIAAGMSLTIFVTSSSVLHTALLKRSMRFSAVSKVDICARGVSAAVAISLAWIGLGYWALVVGAIAQPLTQSIGAWTMCRWIPDFPRRVKGTGSMVRYAINVYGRFSVNYFSRNVDNVLVGWRFDSLTLGFYKKAYDLFALSASTLIASVSNVAVAALSRFTDAPLQYRRYVLNLLSVIAFVGMGVGAILTLIGNDLIRLLLGPGWEPAGRIFSFFGPGVGIMLLYNTHGWIHLSVGKADRWFRWGVIEFAFTALLFLVALPWGPEAIAIAWTASFWILTVPAFWYAAKPTALNIELMFGAVWRYAVASLLGGCASAIVMRFVPTALGATGALGALVRILTVSVIFAAFYLFSVVLLHGNFEPFYLVVGLIGEMLLGQRRTTTFATVEPPPATDPPQGVVLDEDVLKPLVSILIPAFNAEEWIAETLRSALNQTWSRREIIVVDDGSTDQTLTIARQFEASGVIVVHQSSRGAAAARNHCYSLSHGEYIQWLDADDLLAPDKIERQMALALQCRDKRTLLSSAWGSFMHRYYRAQFIPTALWRDLSPVDWLYRKLNDNLYMQTASWLVSRELAEAAGPWDTRLLSDDDGEYFCRVLAASTNVRFVSESKAYYRSPGLAFRSLSYVGQSGRKIDAHWLSMQLHVAYLRSLEDSERVRVACLNYLQTSLMMFYPDKSTILAQVDELARDLGGKPRTPGLSWKYSWMKTMFGWAAAKRAQMWLLGLRWSAERVWDRILFEIDRSTPNLTLVHENKDSQIATASSEATY